MLGGLLHGAACAIAGLPLPPTSLAAPARPAPQPRVPAEELADGGWYCQPADAGADGEGSADEEMSGAERLSAARLGSSLLSPTFRGAGASPRGASPGQRGFPTAPSPFRCAAP